MPNLLSLRSRILKLHDVIACTGLSRASIYRLANEGLFPRPIKTGIRASGFIASEIDAFLADRAALREPVTQSAGAAMLKVEVSDGEASLCH